MTATGNLKTASAAGYTFQSEEEKKTELKKALIIDVTTAYPQILFAQEMLTVANSKLESSEEQLRMNQGFFDAGRMAKVEVLNMKA